MKKIKTIEKKIGDTSKPILELLEHEDVEWLGVECKILFKEEKIVDRLEEEFDIQIISNPNKNKIRIRTKNHVGVIEFENFTLRVKPKFVKSVENFGKLIDFTNNLKDQPFDNEIKFVGDYKEPMEIIIKNFVETTQKLIHQGLYRSYVEHQEDVSFLRGKLIMKQQILNDLKFNMKFNCEFDEFTSNNLENQIILFTLKLCKFLTKFNHKKKLIQKLIHQIDSQIDDKRITIQDFRKISYTRLNTRYEKPHHLAKIIIKNIGMQNLNYQKTKFIIPFFVKMYDVWEQFLENLFKYYYDDELMIKPQDYHNAWFKDGQKDQGIKPDIIIKSRDNQILSIIDAKYMHEIKNEQKYQIAFYLNHLKFSIAYAILPKERNEDCEFSVPEQNISIKVRHVPIDEYLNILYSKKPYKEIKKEISLKLKNLIPLEN
jgi:5-methylcytosine-specific restriction enzyme subunit McrC